MKNSHCNGERGVALQTPWNAREFGLRDPDGNGLTVNRDLRRICVRLFAGRVNETAYAPGRHTGPPAVLLRRVAWHGRRNIAIA
jgi:hypothetical protein